jgi:hypothetical protein
MLNRQFPVKPTVIFTDRLFEGADAERLAAIAEMPSIPDAAAAAQIMSEVFAEAVGWAYHDDKISSHTDRQKFYDAVIENSAALASALGLSDNPVAAAFAQSVGGNRATLDEAAEIARTCRSRLDSVPDLREFGLNPPQPDALQWLNRDLLLQYARTPWPKASRGAEQDDLADKQKKLIHDIEDEARAALPLCHLRELQAASKGWGVTEASVNAALQALPHQLALLMKLAEYWKTVPVPAPRNKKRDRSFRNEVFRGLWFVHEKLFGELAIPDAEREPNGRSILWIEAVLFHAAERIKAHPVALVADGRAFKHDMDDVMRMFAGAASLGREAIKKRILAARQRVDADPIFEGWPRTDPMLSPVF